MKTIYVTMKVVYDEDRFPEGDMNWAVDKLTEGEQIWNIGYDSEAFDIESKVTYTDGGKLPDDRD